MPTRTKLDLAAIDHLEDSALACGALQPIATEAVHVYDDGIPFVLKWISPRAERPVRDKPPRGGAANPFLAPEPPLTLGPLAPNHVVLLNKYPVMARHLLIVTRDYEAQTRPLTPEDFEALAQVIAANGGLGFYNGGEIAGASQAHKHLQWIPALPPLAARLPELRDAHAGQFDFRHAYTPLAADLWQDPARGERLAHHYRQLLRAVGMADHGEALSPYNLLLTRQWMWLIPRRAEAWRDMSVNALGFAGSLFVKTPERLAMLREAGPMRALRGVSLPGRA